MFKCYIFDVDGTLVTTKKGGVYRHGADDWQWLPGRLEKLKGLRESGAKIAFATNQGGVGYGFMTEGDIAYELAKMSNEGGFHAGCACYTHPNARLSNYRYEDPRRKPGPGMLLEIMEKLSIVIQETVMIGDMDDDAGAAYNAGASFIWSQVFFAERISSTV